VGDALARRCHNPHFQLFQLTVTVPCLNVWELDLPHMHHSWSSAMLFHSSCITHISTCMLHSTSHCTHVSFVSTSFPSLLCLLQFTIYQLFFIVHHFFIIQHIIFSHSITTSCWSPVHHWLFMLAQIIRPHQHINHRCHHIQHIIHVNRGPGCGGGAFGAQSPPGCMLPGPPVSHSVVFSST